MPGKRDVSGIFAKYSVNSTGRGTVMRIRNLLFPRFAAGALAIICMAGFAGCTIPTPRGDITLITVRPMEEGSTQTRNPKDVHGKRAGSSTSASSAVITPGWSTLGIGLGGPCNALALAPDGTLYAGGDFTTAGGVSANHVAMWNGSAWAPLGSGLNGEVLSLAVAPDSTLYAGGRFTMAGEVKAKNIAMWNGSSWVPLGMGLDGELSDPAAKEALRKAGLPPEPVVDGEVAALALAPDGTLYAGGRFARADGKGANSIAKWNGTTWSPLGSGLTERGTSFPPPPVVAALAIAPDGTLYAGGSFDKAGGKAANHIAKWNGSTWSPLGAGVRGYKFVTVNTLALAPDGTLYVGGHFDRFGTMKDSDCVFNLAKWRGSAWSTVIGDGVRNIVTTVLVAPNGNLLVATDFGVGVWNGSGWSTLGEGAGIVPGKDSGVSALALAPSGMLYVGGGFVNAAGTYEGDSRIGTVKGGKPVNYIIRWKGLV